MNYPRLLKLPKNHSFFLFGARGTGKSTLLNAQFPHAHVIDLLDVNQEEAFAKNPLLLKEIALGLPKATTHILIDEIQKLPALLDVVHSLIESTDKIFVMTGSSAKKLKHGGANLLAGRAFVYNLFPLSFLELGTDFNLQNALQFGTLPKLFHLNNHSEQEQFLRAYTQVYLREEIWVEQLVRKPNPFRKFLEVAAQCNGKLLNIANISRDVGVDDKTIVAYFNILEETLIGFYLEPFHHSFRKRLAKKPKFYFFDPGVVRALALQLTLPLQSGTSGYGEAFEHLVICECFRLKNYFKPDFKLSFLQTQSDVEIDLVIERPGQTTLFVEIKSTTHVQESHLKQVRLVALDLDNSESICLSNDPHKRVVNDVTVYPWQEGLRKIFLN